MLLKPCNKYPKTRSVKQTFIMIIDSVHLGFKQGASGAANSAPWYADLRTEPQRLERSEGSFAHVVATWRGLSAGLGVSWRCTSAAVFFLDQLGLPYNMRAGCQRHFPLLFLRQKLRLRPHFLWGVTLCSPITNDLGSVAVSEAN